MCFRRQTRARTGKPGSFVPSFLRKKEGCFAASPPALSGVLSLVFLHLHTIFFLQTAGLQDCASHCAKILSAMYAAFNPDVMIKLDNALCRQLILDVLRGKASCDNACGLKEGDNIETVCRELRVSRRLMRTLPHIVCSMPIPPSRTSVPCSLPRPL
jgi:hypothetical protein